MTIYNSWTMKQTTPSTRAPRQKAGESDSAFKKRTEAYYKAKEIRDYENRNPDLEPEQAEDAYITKLAAQIEEEASLALSDPEDEEAQYASRHHNPTPYLGLKPAPEPQEAPQAPSDLNHVLSRLDELQGGVARLESLVDKLARLIAATMPARTLKPAAKAAVLSIAPELAEAYRDDRVREICETYEHVVNMGYAKKRSANFPRALDDKIDYTGYRPEDTVVCRVIPYSALIARCSAKKSFRVVQGEDSAVQNVKLACIKAGMVVTTLDKAGMKRGSHVQIVMDHAEAVKRGLVKGLEPVPELPKPKPEPKPAPKAVFDKAAWEEPEPTPPVAKPAKSRNPRFSGWDEQEDTSTVPDEVLTTTAPPVDEPDELSEAVEKFHRDLETTTNPVDEEIDTEPSFTTTNPVDDEIDTEPWEEEEDDGYNEDPIALFRESGEQQKKSSKAVDLFAD